MNVKYIQLARAMCAGAAVAVAVYDLSAQGRPDTTSAATVGQRATNDVREFQLALLEVAFEAATAIPLDPHIKDRCLAQERVVNASLKLNDTTRALKFTEQIHDWRRGAAYADLAFHCVQRGELEGVEHLLKRAAEAAMQTQEWRRDRIHIKIARTRTLLEQHEQAKQLEAGVSNSEMGKVHQVRAMMCADEHFESQFAELQRAVATQDCDLVRYALEAKAQLFDRFYSDAGRRDAIEQSIKQSWRTLPIVIRIELVISLAEFALEHNDPAKALILVNDAQAIMAQHRWTAEVSIVLSARLAAQRHRAGDAPAALRNLEAALAQFDTDRQQIMGIDQAGVLREIAASYQVMGDCEAALRVYRRAIEVGADNPNGRPRALDLSATCASMAMHAIEPDDALWASIRRILEGLQQPW